MKLFNSIGPNPKVVRMFMAELGIEIEKEEIDLMGGANRQEPYLLMNPGGQLPALELDSGAVISEITGICEYLSERQGGSSLIGQNPEERALTRMWVRRIDLGIVENITAGFRYAEGAPIFQDRMTLIPNAAEDLKKIAQEKITWLDNLIAGKEFICGDRFSLADIMLFVFLEFGATVGQPLNEANKNITAWYGRVSMRASTSA
ncbi:MAG: glutathione S-transferase [Gammaproteobacteria bacterium]|nr:glutathione S-transferase [Gammaproteobacteria bacterium]